MPPFAGSLADGQRVPRQARLDGVEQARLAHARPPGDRRDLALESLAQLLHAPPRLGRHIEYRILQIPIEVEQGRGRAAARQVGLVDDDQRRDPLTLGDDQQAV
jgi:hypothetical protein